MKIKLKKNAPIFNFKTKLISQKKKKKKILIK